MRKYLDKPDDMEAGALRRLQSNGDFQRVYHWLARSLAGLDEGNRHLADAVQIRMGQGAAGALAEFLDHTVAKPASSTQTATTGTGSP